MQTLRILNSGERDVVPVSVDDFPACCVGFRWPAPGILRGAPPSDTFSGELVARLLQSNGLHHLLDEGKAIRLCQICLLSFARMLAKIAHSYAVASLGLNGFRPLLQDLITGKSSNAHWLVGGDESPWASEELATSGLHYIYLGDCIAAGNTYVVCGIQLFCVVDMPKYHVVVGHKLPPSTL